MKRHIEDAAAARSDLNIFYGVIAILEGGTLSSDSDRDAQRIIEICKSASQKALGRMDRSTQRALEIGGRCALKKGIVIA